MPWPVLPPVSPLLPLLGYGVADIPAVGVPDSAADEDNAAPTALAAAKKLSKELLVPLAPGLIPNTIPLPQ